MFLRAYFNDFKCFKSRARVVTNKKNVSNTEIILKNQYHSTYHISKINYFGQEGKTNNNLYHYYVNILYIPNNN